MRSPSTPQRETSNEQRSSARRPMVTKIKLVPRDKVKDRPFRNKKRTPIDTDKVKHIAESVTATDFWKGIQGREVDGLVEVAFGHHRIDAARLLGMKEIPIEVLKLSDAEIDRNRV